MLLGSVRCPRLAELEQDGKERIMTYTIVSRGLLATMVLTLATRSTSAQTIRGKVTEGGTDSPLSGVTVAAVRLDSTLVVAALTDSTGAFALTITSGDSVVLIAQRIGYNRLASIPFVVADSLRLEIRMAAQPIPLPSISVTAASGNLQKFLERRRSGFGRYYGPEEIANMRVSRSSEFLYRLNGAVFFPRGHGVVARDVVKSGIGYCSPRVFIDGALVEERVPSRFQQELASPVPVDQLAPPSSVRAVEVYTNPVQAPPEFQSAVAGSCAIVLIWTDYGFGIRAKSQS